MRQIKATAKKFTFNSHAYTDFFITKNYVSLRIIACLLCSFIFQSTAFAKIQYVSIGTGGVNGVYYPTGGAICYLLNQSKSNSHCEVKSTLGSIYNLNSLKDNSIEIGIVQSDWQFNAYNGTSVYKEYGRFDKLRSLFSLHSEPFTVLARKDAKIEHFEDLKGKRVNIGAPDSGQRATMKLLLSVYGWQLSDFAVDASLMPSEQAQALCDNKVDAIIYVVGHPNSSIKEATSACQTKLVSVTGPKIDKLIKDHNYYEAAKIPAGMYHGNPEVTDTFGVAATLVTTDDLPEQVAYDMVKAVFEKYEYLVQLHPAFSSLTKKSMALKYLSAPLHPGALRYYQEIGLIEGERR
jgi:uncharacterized protein